MRNITNNIIKHFNIAINNYKMLCNEIKLNFEDIIRVGLKHTNKVKIIDYDINIADFKLSDDKNDGLISDKSNVNLVTTLHSNNCDYWKEGILCLKKNFH